MNKNWMIFLLCILLPGLAFSQRKRKKKKTTTINVTTSFNYYPSQDPYNFVSLRNTQRDELDLNFVTSRSGTFTIEEGEPRDIRRDFEIHLPNPRLGLGMSVQIVKNNSTFHEISLTRLSFSESEHQAFYEAFDSLGTSLYKWTDGDQQRAFALGLRYEFGGYFGKGKNPIIRLGLSGGISPSFYAYRRSPSSTTDFPTKARIYSVEIAVIPNVSIALSKKVFLDFKLIPNILLRQHERVTEENPNLSLRQQRSFRNIDSPELNMAFSLSLKYQVKAPKKRRRRS